jgi:hypothetical protein
MLTWRKEFGTDTIEVVYVNLQAYYGVYSFLLILTFLSWVTSSAIDLFFYLGIRLCPLLPHNSYGHTCLLFRTSTLQKWRK